MPQEAATISIHGALRYGPLTPLKSDIMGPFRFVPGMQCNHGVISMGHRLEGTLALSGAAVNFSCGSFTGCICAVLYGGRAYRLATYRGVRVARWSEGGAVFHQGKYRLSAELLAAHAHPPVCP